MTRRIWIAIILWLQGQDWSTAWAYASMVTARVRKRQNPR